MKKKNRNQAKYPNISQNNMFKINKKSIDMCKGYLYQINPPQK